MKTNGYFENQSFGILMRTMIRPLARVLAVFAALLVTVTLLTVPQQWSSLPEAQAQGGQNDSGRCGSSVAFVVDLSNSLSTSDVNSVKNTLNTVVDSLAGAPYNIGIYTFGTNSPYQAQLWQLPRLNNVSAQDMRTAAGQQMVSDAIDSMYNVPNPSNGSYSAGGGGTNWQGGLQAVANDMETGANYDVVYFITDGQPTFDNAGANHQGNTTEMKELNNAIVQSNRIEQYGGRVIPIGVGMEDITIPLYDEGRTEGPWWNREWVWRDGGGSWRHRYNADAEYLLNQIATTGESPILAPNYAELPPRLISNFAAGCLQVIKEIVDADGNVIADADPSGWTFDLTNWEEAPATSNPPSTLTTGATGVAEASIQGMSATDPASVTVTERGQSPYSLRQQNGDNARCVAYQVGGDSEVMSFPNVGDSGVRVTLDESKIISCTFQNLAHAPLTLEKRVEVNQTQLQDELNDRSYDFTYTCTVDGSQIAQGSATIQANEQQTLETQIPVGAECTITEDQPETVANRFDVTTSWAGDNIDNVATSNGGLTTTFRVSADAYRDTTGASAVATNSFDAHTASISVRKHIVDRESLPADGIPSTFTIRYECRYVPDPENPPEQGGGTANPYYVAGGTVTVPNDGTPVEIVDDEVPNGFPVGTQCLWEELSPGTNPATIPGFDLATTWNSDICLNTSGNDVNGLNACAANYTWVPSEGNHTIEVSNEYTRQTGAAVITKELTGPAQAQGTGQPFEFDLYCGPLGDPLFEQTGITVSGGASFRVPGIPIGVDCTITELESDISGVDVTYPSAQTFRVTSQNQDVQVNISNQLDYQMGEIWVEKDVDASGVQDLTQAGLLTLESFPVTAICTAPGQAATTHEVSVTDGASTLVGSFPVGTTCSLEEDYDPQANGFDAIDHLGQFSASNVTVSSEQPTTVTLTNQFRTSATEMTIAKTVNVAGTLPDLGNYVPDTFEIQYSCVNGPSGTAELSNGGSTRVEGIIPGSECTVTEIPVDSDEVERTTTINGEATESYTVQIPSDGTGVSVNVVNDYTAAMANVSVDKNLELVDMDGVSVDPALRDAVIGADRQFTTSFVCVRDGQQITNSSVNLKEGITTTVAVPVGADCEFWENPAGASIPSTDGPDVTYGGTGAENAAGDRYELGGILPNSTNQVTVNNSYVLQTGSFNMKKKVDGEGVATIHADKDFDVNYVCTFNDMTVANGTWAVGRFDNGSDFGVDSLPVGTDCVVTETPESAAEDNAQWDVRWTVAAGPTGWELEQTCETSSGCDPTEQAHSINFEIQPSRVAWEDEETGQTIVPEDYFQGTLVVWNTYNYEKVGLEVTKELAGDGPALANEDTFTFELVCTDPNFAGSGLDDFIPDPTIRQVVEVNGAGEVQATTPVPMGYECSITERPVNAYDADVSASFVNATTEGGVAVDPNATGGAVADFEIDPATNTDGGTYSITVTNNYERARADLSLAKELTGAELAGNVNAYLTNPNAFAMQWRCEDPYLNTVYEGQVDVGTDGTQVGVTAGEERLPASSLCEVEEIVDGQIPAGFEDVVNASHNYAVTRGPQALQLGTGQTATTTFGLSADETTVVTFDNSYRVDQITLGFDKYIEGDPNGEVVNPLETDFTFHYVCTVENLLPGQDAPAIPGSTNVNGNVVNGTVTLQHGQSWDSGSLPTGSYCEVREEIDPEFEDQVEEAGLRLAVNYVYPTEGGEYEEPEPQDPNQVPQPVIGPDDIRIPLDNDDTVQLGGESSQFAWILNSFFRDEGDIQVQKVNPDGNPLEGARFAIYPVDPDDPNQPAAEPVSGAEDLQFAPLLDADSQPVVDEDGNPVADPTRFVASLRPGTYYLVETQSGTNSELLPQPWRFSVQQTNGDDPWSDLEFALSSYDTNSGLITVADRTDNTSPAIIQVANVESGELPLTGDRGIWWRIGAGAMLIALAALFYLRRRA